MGQVPIHEAGQPSPTLTKARRLSKSTGLMGQDIAEVDTEGERVLRREEAEDKARSLRDAKLISATDDEHGTAPNHNYSHEIAGNLTMMGSSMPVSYPTQGDSDSEDGVMALTQENVEKFNSVSEGTASIQPIDATPADIPGPPPGLEPLASVATPASLPVRTAKCISMSPKKQRIDVGGLKPGDRSKSDWSTSTAKPRGRRRSSEK